MGLVNGRLDMLAETWRLIEGRIDRLPEIFGADIREFKHVTRDMKLKDER